MAPEELLFLQCEYDRARTLLQESASLYRGLADERGLASALRESGCVEHEQGRYERARALLEASLALWRRLGDEAGIAETLPYLAMVAWLEADHDRAVEYALSTAESQGAAPDQALAERKQAEALTRREREVALLAARELTNRQIARELVLSEHTVATHVRRILNKLDLRSRAQITAWVDDQGPLP